MSKIGKLPVTLPASVKAEIESRIVTVTGPKGKLTLRLPRGIDTRLEDNQLVIKKLKDDLETDALSGTVRSLLFNMVHGVSDGWSKKLELVGTGYRAEVSGKDLVLTVGYSHPVRVPAPEGISYKVEKNVITVEGIDKIIVGETSAKVRGVRPPEPYKGKGIKYTDEVIRRKAGKAAKTSA